MITFMTIIFIVEVLMIAHYFSAVKYQIGMATDISNILGAVYSMFDKLSMTIVLSFMLVETFLSIFLKEGFQCKNKKKSLTVRVKYYILI